MPLFPGAQKPRPDPGNLLHRRSASLEEMVRQPGIPGSPPTRPGQPWPHRCSTTVHRQTSFRQMLGHFSDEALAHYARYNDESMAKHLKQVWAAGPGTDKPGTILLRPGDLNTDNAGAVRARIDLAVVPVEHGICRYRPVVGGDNCPFAKNCTNGPQGPCEHFALTGADLAYWERKRDAAFPLRRRRPQRKARDYILSAWDPWQPVLAGLREALAELGLLEEAEKLDLRSPIHTTSTRYSPPVRPSTNSRHRAPDRR